MDQLEIELCATERLCAKGLLFVLGVGKTEMGAFQARRKVAFEDRFSTSIVFNKVSLLPGAQSRILSTLVLHLRLHLTS